MTEVPIICRANQWTGFYMRVTLALNGLNSLNSFMAEVPTICRTNQWTGFYMIETSLVKELKLENKLGDDPLYLRNCIFEIF